MATIRYLPSIYCENVMHLAWIYAKLSFIEVLRFIQVTKPIVYSHIIRFQVEQTNNIVALAVFMFILNISVERTKFQYNGGSISNRNLTITLSIDIYDSGQCKVIHPNSHLHVFWHPRNSKKYMYTDSRL